MFSICFFFVSNYLLSLLIFFFVSLIQASFLLIEVVNYQFSSVILEFFSFVLFGLIYFVVTFGLPSNSD
ncbi:hypothetical protein CW304_15075 [Bacillus sp. UFRGS-B20]|nr:hypothetical protein CW304_15075 [Bacillus sp. UFRGS-B20]